MKYQIKNLLIGAMMVIAFGSCSEQEPGCIPGYQWRLPQQSHQYQYPAR